MALQSIWSSGYLVFYDGADTDVGGKGIQFGQTAIAALLHGGGTSSSRLTTTSAGKNFLGYWVEGSAATGDTRGLYMRLYLSGAGGGEAVRAYTTAAAAGVATGGTANGLHASLSINASSSISGAGNAIRATLDAAADTRTLGGTLAAIQADSNVATGNTLPATHSFIRFTDSGAVRFTNLFQMPNVSNGTIFAAHVTQVMSHSIKIVSDDGTAYYLMCTDTATNRS